jgi:hypothetical protein
MQHSKVKILIEEYLYIPMCRIGKLNRCFGETSATLSSLWKLQENNMWEILRECNLLSRMVISLEYS